MTTTTEPTQPGWYATANGSDYLIYLRLPDIDVPGVFTRTGQWMAFTADGYATECEWGYIAQAGPIVPLIKATANV
jgi:hypothetical protein